VQIHAQTARGRKRRSTHDRECARLGSTGPGSITCGVRQWRRQATGSPRPTRLERGSLRDRAWGAACALPGRRRVLREHARSTRPAASVPHTSLPPSRASSPRMPLVVVMMALVPPSLPAGRATLGCPTVPTPLEATKPAGLLVRHEISCWSADGPLTWRNRSPPVALNSDREQQDDDQQCQEHHTPYSDPLIPPTGGCRRGVAARLAWLRTATVRTISRSRGCRRQSKI